MGKASLIQWGADGDRATGMDEERNAKIQEMFDQGKTTDIKPIVYDEYTFTTTRSWVDASAAQEYIDFITNLAPRYGKSIVSASVIDVA